MKYYLKICVVLTLICSVMVGLLAAIHGVTSPIIEENELALQNKTVAQLFPDMAERREIDINEASDKVTALDEVYNEEGALIGYCANVKTMGYAGSVTMMVGTDEKGAVVGVRLISHAETKGLTESDKAQALCAEFEGAAGKQSFAEQGGEIDKIAGATYSSRAVLDGVNAALAVIEEQIGKGAIS